MVILKASENYKNRFSKIKESFTKERIIKLIQKLLENPEVGKSMRHERKGTREVYLGSFRLSYSYDKNLGIITLLDFYHKDEQ